MKLENCYFNVLFIPNFDMNTFLKLVPDILGMQILNAIPVYSTICIVMSRYWTAKLGSYVLHRHLIAIPLLMDADLFNYY